MEVDLQVLMKSRAESSTLVVRCPFSFYEIELYIDDFHHSGTIPLCVKEMCLLPVKINA